MKKTNVTFSIPGEVQERLHALIGRRKMSAFVTKVLLKALEDKELSLKKAYMQAQEDPDRKATIQDWSVVDNEDWE